MKQLAEIIEGQTIFHASSSDSVRDVAKMMSDKNVGAVAILDSGRLVGIFSERDLMKRVVAEGLNPEKTKIANVMTKDIVAGKPEDDINQALQKMHAVGCRHLPIIDSGNLVGMVSLRDLLEIDDDTQRKRVSFLSELVTYSPDYDS